MPADPRGVGVRLFLDGKEAFAHSWQEMAATGKRAWAEIASGAKEANPALRAVSVVSNEVQDAIGGVAARAGPAGQALTAFGPIGVALAATLGAVVIAFTKAREAMSFAAELKDQAASIGVGVEALQEFRFAAEEFGASAEGMDSTLQSLTKAIGAMRSGVGDEKLESAIKALGFTPEQIASFRSAEELLPAIADRMRALGDQAQAMQLAQKLGIDEALVPGLMRGGEALDGLAEKARELGIVMDRDLVEKLDKANREFNVAKQVVDAQLRKAFVDLAPAIVAVAQAVANAVTALSDFGRGATAMGRMVGDTLKPLGDMLNLLGQIAGIANSGGLTIGVRLSGAPQAIQQLGRIINMMNSLSISGFIMGLGRAGRASREADAGLQGMEYDGPRAVGYDLSDVFVGTVPPDTDKPKKGGGGGARRPEGIRSSAYGKLEIITVEEIENLRLAMDLETARLGLNKQLIEQLEREVELRKLIADYIKMGQTAEEARVSAELEQSRREAGRMWEGFVPAAKANTFGDAWGDRMATEKEIFDRQRQSFGEAFALAIQDKERFLAQVFGRALELGWQSVGQLIFNLISQALSGGPGQGGFNFFSSMMSAFGFGGGRAAGGDLRGGWRYAMAENGRPELAMFGGQGQAWSADQTVDMIRRAVWGGQQAAVQAAPGKIDMTVNMPLPRGRMSDRELNAFVIGAAQAAGQQAVETVRQGLPGMQIDARLLTN